LRKTQINGKIANAYQLEKLVWVPFLLTVEEKHCISSRIKCELQGEKVILEIVQVLPEGLSRGCDPNEGRAIQILRVEVEL
jgi:hypothetical protein